MDIKKLLDIKKWIKKKKPKFKRRNYGKKKSLSDSWRRPRGIQSKQRKQKKGRPKRVEVGYRSPKKVRGMTRKEGLLKVRIHNVKELGKIDKSTQGIVIASSVSIKNKIKIYEKAKQLGITIIEPRPQDIERKIKELKEKKAKKASKTETKETKLKKDKEKENTKEGEQ